MTKQKSSIPPNFTDQIQNCSEKNALDEFAPAINYSKNANHVLWWSYFLAFLFAFIIFTTPFNEQLARFGALLILGPTIVTGIHVYRLNEPSEQINVALSKLRPDTTCENCKNMYKQVIKASKRLSDHLKLIILIETIFASFGTAIWAFGDILSPLFLQILPSKCC